jgi:hypothetical protein
VISGGEAPITCAMIEAGVAALESLSYPPKAYRSSEMVLQVYLAMRFAALTPRAPEPPKCGHDQSLIKSSVVHCPKCNWWVAPEDPTYKLICEAVYYVDTRRRPVLNEAKSS